ncbi:allantoate deiminase [Sinobaca qinghaiensis]|uniref:Allantoate deiminase n=1 Tax=Sinobaca qinghaiensis TaxID=342944 RepID=A0A419V4J4_9BACL|nr:Zn-dependent hydrolase [Sinobaca qinghaiensis]RKD73420.1 allantoate deiminase [Sinobaca qinghaiensis]
MLAICQVDEKQLWDGLMSFRRLGRDHKGGITRLALSPEDMKARGRLLEYMKDAGLEVRVDEVGNIIGRLEGKVPDAPAVIAGSHIDTVINGGPFDGSLGVIGAVEAVRALIKAGISMTHPIEVISFQDEEGVRFGSGYTGSKGMFGKISRETLGLKDDQGITYKEAYEQAGFIPADFHKAARAPEDIKAYIEMHIEQSRQLEEQQLSVGVVKDIQGPLWLQVNIKGMADHAGATPMTIRSDAALAMAEVMLEVEAAASEEGGVGTVGKLKVFPDGINIIPGEAAFSIDFRHTITAKRDRMLSRVKQCFQEQEKKRGVHIEYQITKQVEPASCSEEIRKVIADSCVSAGLPVYEMNCGAGHDALILGEYVPFGMIFVRSRQGISHHPDEWSDEADCVNGANVLLETIRTLAE